MTTPFDLCLDRQHPQWDVLHQQLKSLGRTLLPVSGSQIADAISEATAPWIVFVDRNATVPTSDLPALASSLPEATASIWIQPWSNTTPETHVVADASPAIIALSWLPLHQTSAVCVRRADIPALPAIDPHHPDALWDWLLRSASRVAVARSGSLETVKMEAGSATQPLPSLVAGSPLANRQWLVELIHHSKPSIFVPEKRSKADTVAVKAGLLQWHDAADLSHQLSQSVEGLGTHQAGDYWHAITHRREPDYSNAKYWLRHLGVHPVFADVAPVATQILDHCPDAQQWKSRLIGTGTWDPFAFVDLCEATAGQEHTPLGTAARQIQAAEMQRLMISTYQDAIAPAKR